MITAIKKYPLISFFVLTYLLNWFALAANVAGILPAMGEWTIEIEGRLVAAFRTRRTLLTWVPNISAAIVVGLTIGRSGVARLFKKFLIWRVDGKWYAFVFFFPFLIGLSAIGLHMLLGGQTKFSLIQHLPLIFLIRLLFSFTTGGIGEEAGWRGFALPKLQSRFGALKASLIIGFIWGFWHMPGWTIRGYGFETILNFMISIVCLSCLLTWVYNKTNESLLMVALIHIMINVVDATLRNNFAGVISNQDFLRMFSIVMMLFISYLIMSTKAKLGFDQEKCSNI